MENSNEKALENLKNESAKNSATLFNLLFLGGLLAITFVLFMVFGGEENSEFSGLNGLTAETLFSGEYSAHLSEKFSAKEEFQNKTVFAREITKYCFGVGNKISPVSSGNFVKKEEEKNESKSENSHSYKVIYGSETKSSEKKETTKEKATKKTKKETTISTPTALPRPSETYPWETTEETTGQKDVTVTLPPETNNKPPR